MSPPVNARVSQAHVSQAISRQERRLGGRLFDRSNRRRIQTAAQRVEPAVRAGSRFVTGISGPVPQKAGLQKHCPGGGSSPIVRNTTVPGRTSVPAAGLWMETVLL